MKKILSILFAAIMVFSVVSCLSVGALSDSTADEVTDADVNTGIDPELDLQVKKDVYENIYKGIIDVELDDIVITYFGALSDGSLILNYTYIGAGHVDAIYTETIGDYYYVLCPTDVASVYRDHDFCDIFTAYDKGLIDDNSLAELCEISKEYSKHPYNYCYFNFYPITEEPTESVEVTTTETPTQAVTVAQPTTEITATSSENLKSSTSDTAKTKSPATSDTAVSNKSNGTVQTGQSSSLTLLTLILVISAAAAAVFIRFRYRG